LFVPGIIGARLFYLIEYWPEQYLPVYQQHGLRALLVALIDVSSGGLVVYGSFLGAVTGLLAFVRKYRLPLLAVCDLIAPSIMLGMFLGRLGCLANGCCYGGACDRPWAITFPPEAPPYLEQVARGQMAGMLFDGDPKAPPVLLAVDPQSAAAKAGLKPGDQLTKLNGYEVKGAGHVHGLLREAFKQRQPLIIEIENRAPIRLDPMPVPARSHPIHPTQIYSSLNALVLCLLLLAYDPFRRRDGELFALMLSVYPIARFLLEIIRTDESSVFGTGLSISQNVSLALLLAASGLWCYILTRPPGRAFG
ncbi:MAG TPA: prolipoprotein diacylglyceryl transferase family protein, partial [Thermoguttaceae bacterium]|nr:prolipoprotein diacylglyceryl transferase family protein [Thermoguttaceae bacterium]